MNADSIAALKSAAIVEKSPIQIGFAVCGAPRQAQLSLVLCKMIDLGFEVAIRLYKLE